MFSDEGELALHITIAASPAVVVIEGLVIDARFEDDSETKVY